MEKLILRSLLILGTFVFAACGKVTEEDVSGIDSFTTVSGAFSQSDSTKIEGSGTIRFIQALNISSSRSFTLKASLDSAISASSISVIMYSPNSALPEANGIRITLTRSGASVNGQIAFNGNSASIPSSALTYYYPASLDLVIDVHNVASKARVMIWRRNMVQYGAATADIDTDGNMSSLPSQNGTGNYVGLILQNATVLAAKVDNPKVLD
ncbi:MAG: hypothetical protein HUU57_01260 [Bdellovibrio sp.]|nr:hypothetical protein [Bdellovibrio sp.]